MVEQLEEANQARMQDFADYLEYCISVALATSDDINKRRCWCDGIMPPAIGQAYKIEHAVSHNSYSIEARAWIDEGRIKGRSLGQTVYNLVIVIGENFMTKYKKGESLKECVPSTKTDEWIQLDFDQKHIELQLS